jgi:uncharacterized membrane protein YhaH (DUF805 family)
METIQLLFAWGGRVNRARYFLAVVILFALLNSLGLIALVAMKLAGAEPRGGLRFDSQDLMGLFDPAAWRVARDAVANASGAAAGGLVFRAIASPLAAWCYLAVSAKRLHDRGRSGWWTIPFIVFPGLIAQFDDRLGDAVAASLTELVASILFLWGVIETSFLKGTRGPNRYGPDPLETVDPETRWDQQSELESVPHSASPSPGSHGKREHD